MLFEVSGVGRLAKDIEIRYTESGTAIALFSLVSSKKYKDKSGEDKEEICFIECIAFGRVAEICNQYLKKGSKIFFRGELKQNTWIDQNGNNRSKHTIAISTIEMLDCKEKAPQGNYQSQASNPYTTPKKDNRAEPKQAHRQQQSSISDFISENEIPF